VTPERLQSDTVWLGEPHDLREALRRDVVTLYKAGAACRDSEVPTVTALVEWFVAQGEDVDRGEVLKTGTAFIDENRRKAATALLDLDNAPRPLQRDRLDEAARHLGYMNGESLRKSRQRGRAQLDVLFDEVCDKLVRQAGKVAFAPERPPWVSRTRERHGFIGDGIIPIGAAYCPINDK
jgi:hypothetical protein